MAAFDYRQALEIRDAFARRSVRYLFIGKSGAILLGYPDTTQDADLFVEKSAPNGRAVVAALGDLEFPLTDTEVADIERGKDFVQICSRRLSRVPSRRHHREQGGRESREGPRESSPAASLSGLLGVATRVIVSVTGSL